MFRASYRLASIFLVTALFGFGSFVVAQDAMLMPIRAQPKAKRTSRPILSSVQSAKSKRKKMPKR